MTGLLAFMANGAMLGFIVFHRDLEHVVASNAHSMDFRRLLARVVFLRGFSMLRCVRLAHWRILTRNAGIMKTSPHHHSGHPAKS
jgi:hypothetical protein